MTEPQCISRDVCMRPEECRRQGMCMRPAVGMENGNPVSLASNPACPRVVHLKREPYDVRIDRQTVWGNPFVIGKDGNREQVIAKYRAWITAPDNAHMIAYARQVLRGKTLGCWCAPKACHGDVLLEIANG